jgi:broad-specificity NMP kinase
LVEQLCQRVGELQLVDVNAVVKAKALHDGLDEEWNSLIVDEDKIVDELDDQLSTEAGGVVVDYHGCDFFPERWFDVVVVCAQTIPCFTTGCRRAATLRTS